jgi:hypothetical protein
MGYPASALVLAAFGMKDMVNLRIVAICSNFAFITYALLLSLTPTLILHVVLLPLNGWRLAQALRDSGYRFGHPMPASRYLRISLLAAGVTTGVVIGIGTLIGVGIVIVDSALAGSTVDPSAMTMSSMGLPTVYYGDYSVVFNLSYQPSGIP